MVGGFSLFYVSKIFPIFQMVYFDYIGLLLMAVPSFVILYRLYTQRLWHHANRLPLWKHLIDYLRRDNEVIPIVGTRAYPGESFLDVKKLGLIEFLGKDCYYQWGDKKTMWGLENINFSPDPRYYNFTHMLYNLGFSDDTDVRNVLLGEDLELMAKVYQNMIEWDTTHGVNKLISDMKNYEGPPVKFSDKKDTSDKVYEFIDKHLKKKEST